MSHLQLELYLFAMSLCSFWDPKRLQVFCIDVIYFIIIGGYYNWRFVTTSNYNKVRVHNIYAENM